MFYCLIKKGYMIWYIYVVRFSSSIIEFVFIWNIVKMLFYLKI